MPELPSNRSKNWFSIPEVNSWLYLLTEIGIHPQFRKLIPSFISKVKELTSGIEDAFLTLLERNLVMHLQFQKWIPQFRGVKSWKMIGFKFHDNLTEKNCEHLCCKVNEVYCILWHCDCFLLFCILALFWNTLWGVNYVDILMYQNSLEIDYMCLLSLLWLI